MGKAKPTKKKYGKQRSVGRWYSPDPIHKANIERDKRNRKRAARNPSAARPPVPPLPPPQPSFPSPTKCAVNEKRQRTKQCRKIGWGRDGNEAAPKAVVANPEVQPTRKTRINWSTSTTMKEAVESYFQDQGKEGALTARAHAVLWKIPVDTFYKYVHKDPKKRRPVGAHTGRKMLVSEENCEFLVQHTIRADRANDGFTTTQVVANLQHLQPEMGYIQALNFVQRTFKKRSAGRIKPRPVNQCTVAQQFQWFKNYEKALVLLCEKNTGVCNKTGKHLREVIEHFWC